MNKYRKFASAEQLPKKPTSIKQLREVNGKIQDVSAVVIGGLSLIGESGYICTMVTLMSEDKINEKTCGWSLCIGDPGNKTEAPYYFEVSKEGDLKGTLRGTELPNTMMFFQAEIDISLTLSNAPMEKIDEVITYVLPYICDSGPPPPHPSDEVFDQIVREWSKSEAQTQAARILTEVGELLDTVAADFSEKMVDYWELFNGINRRLNESKIPHAWKSSQNAPDYNFDLGSSASWPA